MIALKTKNLSFSYDGKNNILKNLSISVEEGEFLAILGANGAGKSTLLRLLNGLLKDFQGEIEIFEESIKKIKRDELFRKICTVFQDPNDQLFALTVFDDISFGPRNMGLSE
ncbi:MAG: ATP-binding cassette domain-containing protein, partial [Proteobacteria bacterium]|nr:ATP-binding cassette domain-containing protein [Pseudomonadota bacterium]